MQRPSRRILGGATDQAPQGRPTHPTPSSGAAFPPFPEYSSVATVSKQCRTPGTHGITAGREGSFRFCGKAGSGTRVRSFPRAVSVSGEPQGQPDGSCGKPTCAPSSVGEKSGETGGTGPLKPQVGQPRDRQVTSILGSCESPSLPGYDVPREEQVSLLKKFTVPRG